MASNGGPSAAGPQEPDIPALTTKLYNALWPFAEEDPKRIFYQSFIAELKVIDSDPQIVNSVVNRMLAEKLCIAVQDHMGIGWRLRSQDEAKKYRSLTDEQALVYGWIEEAGDEGIWNRNLKNKINMHEAVLRKCISVLESKNLISEMKTVEHPTRKMYIKASLRPSDKATGSPWFTDGELDEEFINQMMTILYIYIHKHSFYKSNSAMRRKPEKVISKKMSPEQARTAREEVLGSHAQPRKEPVESERAKKQRVYESFLPMPAGYQRYPDVDDITCYIDSTNFTTQTLTAGEIQQLLEVMCYDDRIEKVVCGPNGVGYKALRKTLKEDDLASVFTEAPCGRCPVFDLCEEGGPVGPSNCEYFTAWLAL